MKRRAFLTASMALAASACTTGRGPAEFTHYDLGTEAPPVSKQRLPGSLALDEVSAGGWLQTNAILYRLASRDSAQVQAYSLSRWTESPAALLTQRLRAALAVPAERGLAMAGDGVPTDFLVKIGLDAFEQWVQSPTSSRAVVSLRALLIDGKSRALLGQQVFRAEEACPSVDAEGAVRALRAGSDRAIVALIDWLALTARKPV